MAVQNCHAVRGQEKSINHLHIYSLWYYCYVRYSIFSEIILSVVCCNKDAQNLHNCVFLKYLK